MDGRARGAPSTASTAPARPYVPGSMQIDTLKYANMQMSPVPIGRTRRGGARGGVGLGLGSATGSPGTPHGAGWSGAAGRDGTAWHTAWSPRSEPSRGLAPTALSGPVRAARTRHRRFTPMVPPALWPPSSAMPLGGSSLPFLLFRQSPAFSSGYCIFCTVLARDLLLFP